jgi:two-component system sensor histidine kinase KdpD
MKSLQKKFLHVNTWKHYATDIAIAFPATLAVTGIIYVFHLYPAIPNIMMSYLLIVLAMASTRSLFSAIVASVVAFLSFDFLLVQPLYLFTVYNPEEWLSLSILLITAIITGQLASALRRRASEATLREYETRILYELVRATTSEQELEVQLRIIARSIVDVFASSGVRDCTLILPGESGRLLIESARQTQITSDELQLARQVLAKGQTVDFYTRTSTTLKQVSLHHLRRVISVRPAGDSYARMIPLTSGKKVVGVARILVEDRGWKFHLDENETYLDPRSAFFWTFLEQAEVVIEQARLRRENLQVELLRRTDALRTALLSSVSHDLRTPLASIKASASSLLQNDIAWSEEEQANFASAIERETDRLNHLVGNLLDMSRIEGGALKLEKEWYPFDELVHDVLGHLQTVSRGREIITHIPPDLPPVEIDYLQMDQVMTNLIENALRYTKTPIEISVEAVSGEMQVSVADRGPGIPWADLERIFDKFYRVNGARSSGTSTMGTGLGLAVCRGIIEAHGGRIWAEQRSGGGAIFRFVLPIRSLEEITHE